VNSQNCSESADGRRTYLRLLRWRCIEMTAMQRNHFFPPCVHIPLHIIYPSLNVEFEWNLLGTRGQFDRPNRSMAVQ